MIHCFKSKLILLLLLPLPLLAAEPQEAKDLYELPKLVAVQNRQYYLNREFTTHLGYLPMDSFNKSIVLGASYTHYLSDFIGWEIANFNYCFNQDTGLKKQLLSSFNADTEGLLDYRGEWGLKRCHPSHVVHCKIQRGEYNERRKKIS